MLRYVKFTVGLLLIGTAFLYACRSKEKEDVVPELPLLTDYIAIKAGESILTSAGITVIADTVYVSICPKNAYCLVADNVFVSLRLAKDSENKSVRLFGPINNYNHYGREPNTFYTDSVSVTLNSQPYKVILRGGQYVNNPENVRKGQAVIQVSHL